MGAALEITQRQIKRKYPQTPPWLYTSVSLRPIAIHTSWLPVSPLHPAWVCHPPPHLIGFLPCSNFPGSSPPRAWRLRPSCLSHCHGFPRIAFPVLSPRKAFLFSYSLTPTHPSKPHSLPATSSEKPSLVSYLIADCFSMLHFLYILLLP